MERIEIPLAQGWAKGLKVVFESIESGKALDPDRFLHVKQVHGKNIHEVGFADLTKSFPLAEADGLVARGDLIKKSKKALLVKTPDCLPLIYVDIKSEAVAIIHAGWRGLQQGIHRLPFENKIFDPKSTWVWVGPSLNGKTFEVGPDMYEQFPDYINRKDVFESGEGEKKFFYPWKFLEAEFSNISLELLYNVEIDTFLSQDFASYRRARAEGLAKSPHSNYSWVAFE